MDLAKYQELREKLDMAHVQMLPMRMDKTDLWRMERNCERLMSEITEEEVKCRRSGKPTFRYQDLLVEAEEAVKNLEGYILIAKLTVKERE